MEPQIAMEILRAANFAADAHCAQRRKDSAATPYINHPLGVALLIAEVGGVNDVVTLKAALLHDTVEDMAITLDDIRRHFGQEVCWVVAEVTEDKKLSRQSPALALATSHAISERARIIKLADKLYNLRDIVRDRPPAWSVARAQAYFGWASEVVAGCRSANARLAAAVDAVIAGTMPGEKGTDTVVPCLPPGYQPGDWREMDEL